MTVVLSDFSSLMPYLDGTKFDENLKVKYSKCGNIEHRIDVIIALCKSRRVLHVGCTDHVSLIESKIAHGEWLHGLVTEHSSYTLGVDVDGHAVHEASRLSNLQNMIVGDITAAETIPEISEQKFDIALFGEVVEHIPNPGDFLKSFRQNYGRNFDKVIITVPNAFRGGNIKNILVNAETINSDHRFFFTPYTLSKIVVDAGYRPESVRMASFTRCGRLKSWILNSRPLLAEDIILIAAD